MLQNLIIFPNLENNVDPMLIHRICFVAFLFLFLSSIKFNSSACLVFTLYVWVVTKFHNLNFLLIRENFWHS
jgi:hypothetical protein